MELYTMYNLSASIGTANNGGTWTYAPLGAGIDNMTEALNEVVQQYQFFDKDGYAVNHVTGMAPAVTCSGRRMMDDEAQNFIFGLKYELGASRQSSFKLEWTVGEAQQTLTVPCTICNMQEFGGASTDDAAISFEIRFDGKPALV